MLDPSSRRRLLAGTGVAVVSALGGCLGGGGDTASCADSLPTPVRGDANAPVVVAAYEDYACPHCRHYVLEVAPRLVDEYTTPGKIRYEHHDLPIPVDDPESWRAANAARAVQHTTDDIAVFWQYNTDLYRAQSALGLDTYARLAEQVGADPDVVRTRAKSRCYDAVIQKDRQEGIDRGVKGTPTVFVDGESVAPTYDALSAAIDRALS